MSRVLCCSKAALRQRTVVLLRLGSLRHYGTRAARTIASALVLVALALACSGSDRHAPAPPVAQTSPFGLDAQALSWSSVKEMQTVATGAGTVVAILDSGVDGGHPALRGRVLAGYDAVSPNGGPADQDSAAHGTAVAGLIAGSEVVPGVVAVAPATTILPVRVTDGRLASTVAVSNGIHWAVKNGADVILLPYETSQWQGIVSEALAAAVERGVIVVVSAGNRSALSESPPNEGTVVVASVATNGKLQHYSGRATGRGVVAPGGDADPSGMRLMTLAPGGGTQSVAGTSVSAAFVAGLLAIMRSANPDLSSERLIHCLTATAKDLGALGPDEMFGAGLVDGVAALRCARGPQPASYPTAVPSGLRPVWTSPIRFRSG